MSRVGRRGSVAASGLITGGTTYSTLTMVAGNGTSAGTLTPDQMFTSPVVDTFLPDDILFWSGYDEDAAAGAVVGGLTSVVAGPGWMGAALAWKRWGDSDRSTAYGFSGIGGFGNNIGLGCACLRGLNPSTPVAAATQDYFYSGGVAHSGVTVPAGGALMFLEWTRHGNRDPGLTSFSPASYTKDITAFQTVVLGLWIDTAVVAGATGTITTSPAGTGGATGDAYCGLVALQRAEE